MAGVNILSIDGGAMMGVIPARILSYLDGSAANGTFGKVTVKTLVSGVPPLPAKGTIASAFNTIAGTSTGGLLAAALTVPQLAGSKAVMTGNDALNFYCTNASTIFPGSVTLDQMLVANETCFGNADLAKIVADLYGAPDGAGCYAKPAPGVWLPQTVDNPFTTYASLKSATPTLLITSYNNNPTASPPVPANQIPVLPTVGATNVAQGPVIVTNSTQANGQPLSVFQACLMTSAFPMLLPPVPGDLKFGSKESSPDTCNYFLDGGIYAGNPTLTAYLYALVNNIPIQSFISIGCGSSAAPAGLTYKAVDHMGGGLALGGWLKHDGGDALSALMAHGSATVTNDLLNKLLPGKYFRLEPSLAPSGPPWSSDPDVLAGWIAAADLLVGQWLLSGQWATMCNLID